MIKLALQNVCLAGKNHEQERTDLGDHMTQNEDNNFIILFKGMIGRQDFRALYQVQEFDEHGGEMAANGPILTKVSGQASAPQQLTPDMIEGYFRYNSGAKQFTSFAGQKQITMTTDGISLKKEFQPKTKPKIV